jgi:hypothetical protein
MDPKTRNPNNTKIHNVVSVSKTIYAQKKFEKPGLLKRVLDWIARGADEEHMSRTSCPS